MIGARVLRVEDPRLLTGRGRYLADHEMAGLCHLVFVRSPAAHAVVRNVDASAARAVPGVVAVLTQPDLEAAGIRRMSHLLPIPGIQPLDWGLLVEDRVRFAGEPVAAVIATTRALAEDAAELVEVELDPLPAVVDPFVALAEDAPLLYPDWGTNVFLALETPVEHVEAALAAAPHVLEERITHHRVCALPLEGHGAQAWLDPTGTLQVLASNQQPHQLRTVVAEVCSRPESSVRVVAPDMGGGFGNKQHFTREECLVAASAIITGRPVRWAQDRSEYLTASIHSREQVHDVRVGYDDDGKVLAFHSRITSNVGNPILYFSGIGPSLVTVGSLTGGYDFGAVGWSLRCVATTTCPIGAYRGFGQPQAHLTTERVLDLVAAERGLDPADVRRRNFIADDPGRGSPRAVPASTSATSGRTSISCSTSSTGRAGGRAGTRRAPRDGTSASGSPRSCRAPRPRSTASPVASVRGRRRRSPCCPTGR